MRQLLPSQVPSWRQVAFWIMLGVLLGTALHGYWLLCCVLLVAVVASFILMQ